MQLVFVRLNYALATIRDLYETEHIADMANHYEQKTKYPDQSHYLDGHVKYVYDAHQDLDSEIHQVIFTHNQNALAIFFNRLKEILSYEAVKEIASLTILERAEEYNKKKQEDLKKEMETQSFWVHPYLINSIYLPQYLDYAENVTNNFRKTIEKHVKLYDEGKIQAVTTISPYPAPQINTHSLPELPPQQKEPKLKLNLTIPQIAFLFRLLNDCKPGIFDVKSQTELYRFISANLTTEEKGEKDISTNRLSNLFTTKDTDKNVIGFWIKHLKSMLEQARKS